MWHTRQHLLCWLIDTSQFSSVQFSSSTSWYSSCEDLLPFNSIQFNSIQKKKTQEVLCDDDVENYPSTDKFWSLCIGTHPQTMFFQLSCWMKGFFSTQISNTHTHTHTHIKCEEKSLQLVNLDSSLPSLTNVPTQIHFFWVRNWVMKHGLGMHVLDNWDIDVHSWTYWARE